MNHPRQHDRSEMQHTVPHASCLDARLTSALETAPYVEIPEDFATRVARRLPVARTPALRWTTAHPSANVGRKVAFAALLILAILMLALVPSFRPASGLAWTAAECMLCLEFVSLTLWISLKPQRLS